MEFLLNVVYILFLFSSGVFLAAIPVSIMWNNMLLKNSALELKDIPYEEKYDLDKKENFLNKESKLNNLLIENTPNGLLIMRHNKEEEGFEYWSNKTFDFKILKAACRKYCLVFSIKDIYVDGYKEFMKQKEEWEDWKKKEIERLNKKLTETSDSDSDAVEMEEKDDCVFLKPKRVERNDKTQEKEAKVEWRENKFIWKGKVEESPLTKKVKMEKPKLSFEDFKLLMKEKNN